MRIKIPNISTGIVYLILAALGMFYVYFFFAVNGKYQPNGTDEFLYYIEAKAIAVHNQFTTPISFDGVTSRIGDFGIHGVFYATIDGFWAKLTGSTTPNILALNFCIALLAFVLIYTTKEFSATEKILLAAVLLSYPPLFRYTFSFYKETIQLVWGIVLSVALIKIYRVPKPTLGLIISYFLLVLLYTQFRYNGFLWIFGLLPLFFVSARMKWVVAFLIPLTIVLGVLSNLLLVAPFPYPEVFNYVFMESIKTKPIIDLLVWLWQHFYETLTEFLFIHDTWQKAVLRYVLLGGIISTAYLAYKKKQLVLWGLFAVEMMYLLTTLAFYHAHWELDIRSLSILIIPIAWVLINYAHRALTYAVIGLNLLVLPLFVSTSKATIAQFQQINAPSIYKGQLLADFDNIAATLATEERAVVQLPVSMFLFNQPNFPIHLPLKTTASKPIYYTVYRGYVPDKTDFSPNFMLSLGVQNSGAYSVAYAGKVVCLYRLN